MTRISQKQARKLEIIPNKPSKYRSTKVEIDGIKFDSRKEAEKYCELKLLHQAGLIAGYELQPEFELQPGFRTKAGNLVRAITYRADFRVTHPDGRVVIIDTKGYKTKDYLIKRKMLLFRYPDIEFIEE